MFSTPEKPQSFSIRSLGHGASDTQAADKLADYFNLISSKFDPLMRDQIPTAEGRIFDRLTTHKVLAQICYFKKPKFMVWGDVFPSLMTKFSNLFAMPLTDIHNEISRTCVWPSAWKMEVVTVISKVCCSNEFGEVRNMSCALLVS